MTESSANPQVPREGDPRFWDKQPASAEEIFAQPQASEQQAPAPQAPLEEDYSDLSPEEAEEVAQEQKDKALYPDYNFAIRPLRDSDTWKVGSILAKTIGDPRVQQALNTGEGTAIMSSLVSGFFDSRATRETQLWLADMVGIKRVFSEYREWDNELAKKESRRPLPELDLRRQMDNDVIEEFGSLPVGSSQHVLSTVMDRPDFDPFLRSSWHAAQAAMKAFSRFQSVSGRSTD